MSKLIPATAKKVKALGINAKTEEEAREKLLEILNENGIDGMEEEDTDTLIEIAESFVEDGDGDSEEGADDNEETQNDKLAEEVEEETESDDDEEEGADDNDDDSEEEDEGDEFDDMDRTELKAYIKDNELNITVKKSMSDDDIRELIRAAVAENDEEDNEPEEEEVKPAPKASKKSAEKPAPKKEEKKAAKDEKKEEKKATAGKRGTKLDPKNNEDDREAFDVLKKLFPEDEFNYAWVASAGVTIKHKGINSNRSLVLIENCSKQADGSIKCNLYLLTFNKQLEVLDEAGIEYETCWSGAPLIKGITLDEAVEIISGLLDNIMSSVKKIDKKLGENRKKMEENLEKKAPKKATKKAEPEEEEEDEDDTEETKPAPKKAVAKKSAVASKKTVSKKK